MDFFLTVFIWQPKNVAVLLRRQRDQFGEVLADDERRIV